MNLAVRHCVETQRVDGSWGMAPGARMFDTGVVAFALSRVERAPAVERAIRRAAAWLERARPQAHHPLAQLMEDLPRRLLAGAREPVDLGDSSYFVPVLRRKALLVYALARLAGCQTRAPLSFDELRAALRRHVQDRTRTKRWGQVDLLSLHVLLESIDGGSPAGGAEVALLEEMQSVEGDFVHNPISTAFACLALGVAAPRSAALARCVARILELQHADGTWRYFETDVWDTGLMVRVFRRHRLFRHRCLGKALGFLRAAQNADGGWGFRSGLESDNDSSACALLCFDERAPGDQETIRRALAFLASTQLPDGLWRTWQSSEDEPVKDCVAHVLEALDRFDVRGATDVSRARSWLRSQLMRGGDALARWRADWFHSVPYGVRELSSALPPGDGLRGEGLRLLDQLRREDGGWAGGPGGVSSPLDTGLALAARLRCGLIDPTDEEGLAYLVRSQTAEGTWPSRPCMVGPRPLLIDMPTNTHAFAAWGLMEAAARAGLEGAG